MADPLTSTIRLTQPTVGGDSGTWPTLLNSDLTYIDEAVNQTINVAVGGLSSYTLTADGSSSDQARYLVYNFTGALTGSCTVTLPAVQKVGWVRNSTTGSQNVILSAGGTTLTVAPSTSWIFFYCDGTNVSAPSILPATLSGSTLSISGTGTLGTLSVTGNGTVGGTLGVTGAATFSSTGAFTSTVTAANGTSGSQVVNFSQFPNSLSATGTQTLPGGLILKWGTASVNGGPASVTFANAFPNGILNVQLTINGGSAPNNIYALSVGAYSVSSFNVYSGVGQAIGFFWLAIGY